MPRAERAPIEQARADQAALAGRPMALAVSVAAVAQVGQRAGQRAGLPVGLEAEWPARAERPAGAGPVQVGLAAAAVGLLTASAAEWSVMVAYPR